MPTKQKACPSWSPYAEHAVSLCCFTKSLPSVSKQASKVDGEPLNKWDDTQTSGGVVKTFASKTDTMNALATVENTPGTALPQTGGIGTTLFTALGGLLTATAGAILTMKSYRHRKQNA